jgi:membrane-bound serine protease (ClpP class)
MRKRRLVLWLAVALAGLGLGAAHAQQDASRLAVSIELSGTIDPATERWVDKALDDATDDGARLAIIRLDTPGGLDSSTREIVKRIIEAPMPVVVYVSPDGARAASAGLFVTEAADVAAMAPQTNIGSATPISLGPGEQDEVLGRKIRNDAAAYVRALAEGHGRNPDLAERMVRDAVNVTASEAKEVDLVDLVASDQPRLLRELDGFEVRGPKAQTLDTEGLRIEERDMPLQYEILQLLVNPNVSFLLLTVGLIGLAIELFSPGLVAPGVLGLISFILGLYGTAQLPVTAAGILLLAAAIALMIAEGHLATHGILGAAGVVALVLSGLLLYDTDTSALEISVPVVVVGGALLGGFFAFLIERALRARREPVRTGWEEMIGAVGEVRVALDPVGQVFVEGALWRARPSTGDGPIAQGDRVRVESVDGLTVEVAPVAEPSKSEEGAD